MSLTPSHHREYSRHYLQVRGWRPSALHPQWHGIDERRWGWIVTWVITIVAGIIRLWKLDTLNRIIFDETYYVKDAYSIFAKGYEAKWARGDNVNAHFAAGDFSDLMDNASFVVHPPFGKWLMSVGMYPCGPDNPWGWRIVVALMGTLAVFITMRLAWELFNSAVLVGLAGIFLATDTLHVSMTRIGLLDGILATLIVAGFLTFVKDQQQRRAYLAHELSPVLYSRQQGRKPDRNALLAERFSWSGWLIATGVILGMASAVKWSALYVIAVLGIFLFIRELTARYRGGMTHVQAWINAFVYGGIPAFVQLVVTACITYIMCWFPWFTHQGAWGHGAAVKKGWVHPGSGMETMADFVLYHQQIMHFHMGVTSEHRYQSTPLQWLANIRPTSMAFDKSTAADGTPMVKVMVALGSPVLWWVALGALAMVIISALIFRDWKAGLLLCAYAGIWAPWLWYSYVDDRTIFMFYMVALSPFVALVVTYMVGMLLGLVHPVAEPLGASLMHDAAPRVDVPAWSRWVAWGLVVLIVGVAVFFLPVANASLIPVSHWRWRMWLSSWI